MKFHANPQIATDAAAVGGSGFVRFPFIFENGLHPRHEASLSDFSQRTKQPAHWLCMRSRSNITHNFVLFTDSRKFFLPDEEEASAHVIVSLSFFFM